MTPSGVMLCGSVFVAKNLHRKVKEYHHVKVTFFVQYLSCGSGIRQAKHASYREVRQDQHAPYREVGHRFCIESTFSLYFGDFGRF